MDRRPGPIIIFASNILNQTAHCSSTRLIAGVCLQLRAVGPAGPQLPGDHLTPGTVYYANRRHKKTLPTLHQATRWVYCGSIWGCIGAPAKRTNVDRARAEDGGGRNGRLPSFLKSDYTDFIY